MRILSHIRRGLPAVVVFVLALVSLAVAFPSFAGSSVSEKTRPASPSGVGGCVPSATAWGLWTTPASGAGGARIVTFSLTAPQSFTIVGDTGISTATNFPNGLDFDGAGDLFVTGGQNTNFLFSVNKTTGAATLIGGSGLAAGTTITDLAYDRFTDRMLGVTSGSGAPVIYVINTSTGAATLIGPVTGITETVPVSMAVRASDGMIFLHGVGSDRWHRVDPVTLVATPLNALPFDTNFGQGGTMDPVSGELYHAAFNATAFQGQLHKIDAATGNATLVGQLGTTSHPGTNQVSDIAIELPPECQNTPPVANDDNYSTDEDTPLNVPASLGVLDNDTDDQNDPLTAVLVSGPSHAALFTINSDGSFSYTPSTNYNGPDSFTYKANDGSEDSNVATVNITVNSVNDAPSIVAASGISRIQGTSSASQIATVSDPDNAANTLTVTVNNAASATVNGVTISGIAVNAAGQVTATVAAACNATNASFTLRVTDPGPGSQTAMATLNVTVVNETVPPVINPIANVVATLPSGSATSMPVSFPLPTATDNCSAVTVTTNPVSGSVFNVGTTTVNVTATDANGNTSTATFTVTVRYPFTGFGGRVSNPPALNYASAGNTIPITFSLGGDRGLNIFAPGSPSSQRVNCMTGAPIGASSPASSSLGLFYFAGQYTYYWTTDPSWAGTCRTFTMTLNDGTARTLNFSFFFNPSMASPAAKSTRSIRETIW